ncbi:hypothetical protein [Bacillus sp. ISL-57]|uniref:hypothetical protein n=1 Tax=Bacillus sp. ISL-57 TaxID=2819135 RepID=UPI001BEA5773|nr:hypothetical protein [Bacillus sp. ISL-57]MBT2714759.1 hypothetical protein [Bacillus sp. ISL-57]
MEDEKKPFEYKMKSGNSTIIINSDLMKLTEEERKQWYADELAKGNLVLLDIGKAINNCYRKY